MSKVKLFCFPYAGGSAMVYTKWKKHLHPSIELCPVELAGRGKRFKDPLCQNLGEMVNDVYNTLKGQLDGTPYAFYGHSMGALVAFELAYKVKAANHRYPVHIFFSGRQAPHVEEKKAYHNLSEEKFREEVLLLDGTPKELFEHKDLMDIFIPLLRTDFKIAETYEYIPGREELDCSITVLNGRKDETLDEEKVPEWRKYTKKECCIHMFDGGHFFINDNIENITGIISGTLSSEI